MGGIAHQRRCEDLYLMNLKTDPLSGHYAPVAIDESPHHGDLHHNEVRCGILQSELGEDDRTKVAGRN